MKDPKLCPKCKGKGEVPRKDLPPFLKGAMGIRQNDECPVCHGVGYISQKASDNLTRSASFRKLAFHYYLRACSTAAKIEGGRKVLSPVCHGVGYVEG